MNIISQMETIWPGWTVEERIGAGSYGQVYRVSRTVGNRKYYSAVKVITIPQNETEVKDVFAEEGSHSETVAHFREAVEECTREISMMIDLRGTANVVKVEDFRVIEYKDQIRWDIFIRMEYLTCLTDVIIRKRLSEEEALARAREAMRSVGLDESFEKKSPFDLSGGQKRRAAIAGILAMDPEVLVLDEPTAGLDPKGRDEILDLLKSLHEERNITIILVSHSMEDVANYVSRIIVMDEGRILYDDVPEKVFSLAAPRVTYIMDALRRDSWDVDASVTTIAQARDEILRALGR